MAILIKDPDRCPNCAAYHSLRWDQNKCGDCGTRIFKPTSNFVKIRYDLIFSFWIYFPLNSSGLFKGWVHSDHLKDRDSDVKPNDPNFTAQNPGKSYNTKKRHPGINDPIPLSSMPLVS